MENKIQYIILKKTFDSIKLISNQYILNDVTYHSVPQLFKELPNGDAEILEQSELEKNVIDFIFPKQK